MERDIENQLVAQITRFLLELGKGFAFLGRQYPLVVNGRDYFLDLLFYHARLKCYIVIELKAGEFKPENHGQGRLRTGLCQRMARRCLRQAAHQVRGLQQSSADSAVRRGDLRPSSR
ncbi:MAG: PDDEXK nuclease domain-containing protein [Rhodoferax sp.]